MGISNLPAGIQPQGGVEFQSTTRVAPKSILRLLTLGYDFNSKGFLTLVAFLSSLGGSCDCQSGSVVILTDFAHAGHADGHLGVLGQVFDVSGR